MAIIFKKIKWRNFLSTGDNFTEINLDTKASTLVVGPNGSGKSTLLDALSFALFGKPHRDINKPQLINSINSKNCEVEVEFSVGSVNFRILRGIKPNIFEIWQNGVLVNQEAHSLDYQKVLEQNILKLNHKSFHQIVVLGSSSFIPFMQLPSQHRREVIEDLLDINIFTKMNGILKARVALLRERLAEVNHASALNDHSIETQKKYISDLKKKNSQLSQKNLEKIRQYELEIGDLEVQNAADYATIEARTPEVEDREKLHDRHRSLIHYQEQVKNSIAQVVKEAKFYSESDTCPTCAQQIAPDFKTKKVSSCKASAKKLAEDQAKLMTELETVAGKLEKANASLRELQKMDNVVVGRIGAIKAKRSLISDLQTESTSVEDLDVTEAEQKLRELLEAKERNIVAKSECYEASSYNSALAEMLKDTGIKTKVIRQYLPVMNKLISGYLTTLDFFVDFNLDESFKETIRSRHRDEFSYSSFSEGEKQRIDLALLFTWRQIARMKNSISTNLLVLDETFDSSMDGDGVENLLKILRTLEDNVSIFVISHKTDALDGKFKHRLEFEKMQNFSRIKLK